MLVNLFNTKMPDPKDIDKAINEKFISKEKFAEEIEAIDMGPVEAMRATGANLFQIMLFAVFPQVRVALTGIAIYTWDVAFRAATVVGFFGAGGMGWYLKRNVLQIETERVAAILVSIIVLVAISEILSAWARNRVMKMK